MLTEQFLCHDPPLRREVAAVEDALGRTLDAPLDKISRPARGMRRKAPQRVIGVGGTITTM
ncbi:MAG: hypothetical protein E6H00_08870, partial [Bacillati bacterium ANGP1]